MKPHPVLLLLTLLFLAASGSSATAASNGGQSAYQQQMVLGWADCRQQAACPPHNAVRVYSEDGSPLGAKDLSGFDVQGMKAYNPEYNLIRLVSKDNREIWWVQARLLDRQFCQSAQAQPVQGRTKTTQAFGLGSGGACPQ